MNVYRILQTEENRMTLYNIYKYIYSNNAIYTKNNPKKFFEKISNML